MAERLPWGHKSRNCLRCGKVGPRTRPPSGFGWVHKYCLYPEELRALLSAQQQKAGGAE